MDGWARSRPAGTRARRWAWCWPRRTTPARREEELARGERRAPADMPADVVTLHSVVSVVDEQSGATHDARLVYPRESGSRPGDVSILSPVGAALLGLSIGQTIEWPLPGGRTTRFRVTGVAQA